MAAMRKQRLLQDLYNLTPIIPHPKITPVLKGNCRMQGPVDEPDCVSCTNMVPSKVDEESNIYPKNLNSGRGAESGTCNVCSAPCSSCLHINQRVMGSKIDECSGETSTEDALSFSVNDAFQADIIKKCETGQTSERRNLFGGNSSNVSENLDGEAILRDSDMSIALQGAIVHQKFDNPKQKEGHDDYTSVVTGIEDSRLCESKARNGDGTDLPSYHASDSSSVPEENGKVFSHQTSSGFPDAKCEVGESQNNSSCQRKISEESLEQVPLSVCSPTDVALQNSSSVVTSSEDAAKPQDNLSNPPCGKSSSDEPNSEDLERNLCPPIHGALSECPSEHSNSLSTKEVNSDGIHSDPASDALDYIKKNECNNKVVDESDDSDMVEHDVKVCDICGDAGREDMLAICCRCTDGAEHTYCMREMLDKVPEGDWLCEECKSDEEIRNQKQERISSLDASEKNCSSGQTNIENTINLKSEAKRFDADGAKTSRDPSNVKTPGKRHIDDSEVSSAAKKRVRDSNAGPNTMPISSGVIAFSRDSSYKHLDKGKMKPAQQSSTGTISAPEVSDAPASISKLQPPQGTFVKSNSFNSLNVKPKVKLVDDAIPQKPRSGREPPSLNKKEGVARPIGKSMSFKLPTMGRLSAGESKVKMLSPKFSHIQDHKGLKIAKDRSLFERKNSFNAERPSVSSPMANSSNVAAKIDQKLSSCGEPNLLSSARNHRDTKSLQSDSKSATLSKSSSFVHRRGSEAPVSLGEFKRQSSQSTSVVGVSSANGISSYDLKPNVNSPKEEPLSSSFTAERTPCNANGSVQDGPSQPKESTNFGEGVKESSGSRLKQSGSFGGRAVPCQKCKEIGHLTQFCPADHPGSPASVSSAGKSSRELMDGKDKLKAAIEAAVLRKPGIYRKHRVSDQSDDVSASSINCEVTSQDHFLNTNSKANVSADEMSEGNMTRGNSSADSCRTTPVDNAKQFAMLQVDALTSRSGDACPDVQSEGSSVIRDTPGHVPEAMSILLKTLTIPDHEYIWQGIFEVRRSGKNLNLCDGIQAHLSSSASPKVLEAVNKFPRKVLLTEVPRLSTWPIHFQEYGVKEDNIALFFFAKDLSSYEKSYKMLLDNMMRNDLALRGNLDDIELIIFPSNQLPEKSQRWNTLFFLWGVFRGKRADCSQHVPGSQKQVHIPQDISAAIISLPEIMCALGNVDKDLSEYHDPDSGSEVRTTKDFPYLSQTADGHCGTRVSSQVLPDYKMQTTMEKLGDRLEASFFPMTLSSSAKSDEEMVDTSISRDELRHYGNSLEGCFETNSKCDPELHAPILATRKVGGFKKIEQIPMDQNSHLSGQPSLHQFDESPSGSQGFAPGSSMVGGNISDKMNISRCQVNYEDGSMDEAPCSIIDVKENSRKRQHVDSVERISKGASASTSQVIPGNSADEISVDDVHTSKKRKTGFCGLYRYNNQSQTISPIGGFTSMIHDVVSGSPVQANGCEGAFDGTDVQLFEGNAERYFFPVDPHAEKDVGRDGKSIPWKMNPLEDDGLHDKAPNLELALGAETKLLPQGLQPFLVGKEDKKVVQDPCSHEASTKGEDDEVSASLSLSLSFPFPEEEQSVKSVSKTERQHVNTSLLLFED